MIISLSEKTLCFVPFFCQRLLLILFFIPSFLNVLATNNTSTQASTQAGIQACMQATTQAIMQADEEVKKLLLFCEIPRIRSEMQVFMKISNKEHFRKNILSPLIKGGLVKLTISDKPTSPNQKYYCNKNY